MLIILIDRWQVLSYLIRVPLLNQASESNPNFQLVNIPSWISPNEVLQSWLINTVYHLLVKNNNWRGEGLNRGQGLINFLPLKVSSRVKNHHFSKFAIFRRLNRAHQELSFKKSSRKKCFFCADIYFRPRLQDERRRQNRFAAKEWASKLAESDKGSYYNHEKWLTDDKGPEKPIETTAESSFTSSLASGASF